MGQLVSEGTGEVVLIGAEEDGAGAGHRHGGAPCRGPTLGERVEDSTVGHDDETERPRFPAAEAWPLGWPAGEDGQLTRKGALRGPRHGGHPPDLDRRRRAL